MTLERIRVLPAAVAAGCALLATMGASPADGATGVSCLGKPATYVGTEGPDRLTDGQVDFGHDPVIVLAGGSDRIAFRSGTVSGHVTVCGGNGRDFAGVYGDSGGDSYTLNAGPGADRIGNDDLDDDFRNEVGPMTLLGGSGGDRMLGSYLGDRIVAGDGDDLVLAVDGGDRVYGGAGDDTLYGHGGDDLLFGSAGDDRIEGGGGRDVVDGGEDVDSCIGEVERRCEG